MSSSEVFPEAIEYPLSEALRAARQELRNEMGVKTNTHVEHGQIVVELLTNTWEMRRKVCEILAAKGVVETDIRFNNPDLPPEPGVVPRSTLDTAEMSAVGTAEMNVADSDSGDGFDDVVQAETLDAE